MNSQTLLNEFGLGGTVDTKSVPLPGIEPSNVRADAGNRPSVIQGVSARAGETTYKAALSPESGDVSFTVPPSTPISKNLDNPLIEIVATMLASGRNKKEIAKATGREYGTIARISNQPFTKQRVRDLLRANGQDGIKAFLTGEVLGSLETFVEIRDNPEARSADRLSAANALLDRALGKPTQHIETKKVDDLNEITLNAAELDKRIAETRQKLQASGVASN